MTEKNHWNIEIIYCNAEIRYTNIEIEYAILKSNTAKLKLIALLLKLYTAIMNSITEILKHNIMSRIGCYSADQKILTSTVIWTIMLTKLSTLLKTIHKLLQFLPLLWSYTNMWDTNAIKLNSVHDLKWS